MYVGDKRVVPRKSIFCPSKSISKVLNTPVTWPFVSGISMLNSVMIQQTQFKWLPIESGKVWILGIFRKKSCFCDVIKWFHIFCSFQGWKSLPLRSGTIVPSLVQIQKGVSDSQLLKECSQFCCEENFL